MIHTIAIPMTLWYKPIKMDTLLQQPMIGQTVVSTVVWVHPQMATKLEPVLLDPENIAVFLSFQMT